MKPYLRPNKSWRLRRPSQLQRKKLKRVKEHIAQGRKLIADRQKLIKITNHSDLGWVVVEGYTTGELTEDERDWIRLKDQLRGKLQRERSRPTTDIECTQVAGN